MSRRQARHVTFDGSRVRTRRDELGLTNEELAREVGVSLRTVQRWQDGSNEPQSVGQLYRLARVLDLPPDDLYPEIAAA